MVVNRCSGEDWFLLKYNCQISNSSSYNELVFIAHKIVSFTIDSVLINSFGIDVI